MKVVKQFAVAVALLVGGLGSMAAQDGGTMIFFKDGRALTGTVTSIGQTQLQWRLPGLPQAQTLNYDQIDFIEFPQSSQWVEVMELFQNGQFDQAAEIFKAFSLQKNQQTFYPAPGNFATLAERRLLDCYRRLRLPEEIALVSRKIEWDKLPESERAVASIIDCWSAVGNGDWQGARDAFTKARAELDDTDPAAAELGFLNGLISKGLEDPDDSAVQFGRSFAPDAAADPSMAADALRQAIEQIIPNTERRAELRALVHLYAELHGNGKLWDGAGDFLTKMHAEGFSVEMSLADAEDAQEKPPVTMARYVRIERNSEEDTLVSLAEVEVIFDQVNIAGKGKATQSSEGAARNKATKAELAIDGSRAPGFTVGSFSRTKKERFPWWELDLGGMEPIEKVDLFGHKNQEGKFANPPGKWQIRLLDGSRKEVWAKEVEPGDGAQVSVPITKEDAVAETE